MSTSTALAQIVGSPIAALILSIMDQKLGLSGWQWLFLIEGMCTVVYGAVLRYQLTPSPEKAVFLSENDRFWLEERQRQFAKSKPSFEAQKEHVKYVLSDWRIWYLSAILFSITQAMYGCVFFIPMIVHSFFFQDHSKGGETTEGAESGGCSGGGEGAAEGTATVALLSMLPFASAAVCMVITGKLSEAANERRLHAAIPVAIGSVFMSFTALMIAVDIPVAAFICLTVSAAGIWSFHGPVMTWPASFLERDRAVVGFSMMNSIGSFGGFLGPFLLGFIADLTGGYTIAMIAISIILALGALLILFFPVSASAGSMMGVDVCMVPVSIDDIRDRKRDNTLMEQEPVSPQTAAGSSSLETTRLLSRPSSHHETEA